MTIWEKIAEEALEALGDRARDILSERRAEGKDDSADDITEELSFGGEVEDETEATEEFTYMSIGEAFEDIERDDWASEVFADLVREEIPLLEAVQRTVLQLANEEVEEALADLADSLREDFPDVEEEDYGEEAGA